MSFSKAKLKRFNDVDIGCASPATTTAKSEAVTTTGTPTPAAGLSNNSCIATSTTSSCTTAHTERKEQIEKFFKDAVRFATSSREAKEFAIPKESAAKEDKKSKGLRLFRTPSLPHRLRFRQHSEATVAASSSNNNVTGSTASSTPLRSATTTPVKEQSKSTNRLKGKEALMHAIRCKDEIIAEYLSQVEGLRYHIDRVKEADKMLREENANTALKAENLIHALTTENTAHKELNDQLSVENARLVQSCAELQAQMQALKEQHLAEVDALRNVTADLEDGHAQLEQRYQQQCEEHDQLRVYLGQLEQEICSARKKLASDEQKAQQNYDLIQNLKNTNDALIADVTQLKQQIEQDALAYTQETRVTHNEMECLKNERNTLKHDLASKCELIRSLQDELLDKNCEIDAHCDTIRQLCREKAKYVEKERLMETAEEKVRNAEAQAEQKVQKLESDLENAVEHEKAYWRGELDKRQKLAENEIIKIELEKQDVMLLLESTNDMLRERDEKIQKYEDQLRNGIDYYVQLTDTLQKQVVDLKQEMAKIITEKYNYQLTLSNTRSTVNILMERLKKSDADVEQFKAELESVNLAKGALEQSYLSLQAEVETLRSKEAESESALQALRATSETLQHEVSVKENMFDEILTSEEETLAKFNKIASSFQERIDIDAAHYLNLYTELKHKDEKRELYMQDMKKALDEFATVLQYAQLELDSKENTLHKLREECEQLKLENISLKCKLDESNSAKKENITDLEKIEDLLTDPELRSECDKITNWLLSSTDKCVRSESASEISELLKPTTPQNSNKSRSCTTPVRCSTGTPKPVAAATTPHTPRTPRTPKTPRTPRTTPKKTVLFPGKENVPSPQKQVLKARNM